MFTLTATGLGDRLTLVMLGSLIVIVSVTVNYLTDISATVMLDNLIVML
jgi:hypothetical protein